MSMEKLMSFMRIRFAEEFFIKGFDFFVLVGFSLGFTGIFAVEGFSALCFEVDIGLGRSVDDRSTAAGYAAARAAHDLDEIVFLLAALNEVEEFGSVAGTVSDGDADNFAAQVNFGFFDTFGTADSVEFDVIERFTGNDFINGTESGFHNAAGSTEDDARAGGFTEDGIEVFVGETREVDTRVLDHSGKFANGKDCVDVGETVVFKLVSACLELFGGTRHYRNDVDIFGVDTRFFGIVGFNKRAEHLVRRFAGGEVRDEFGIEFFAVFDPAGRAGGDHRESTAVGETTDKLGAFFHYRKVGGEVGIEYLIEAEATERSGEFSGNGSTYREAEFLAESSTDGGSGLDDDVFGRIGKSGIDFGGAVFFMESADGASEDTLAAVYAGGIGKGFAVDGADGGLYTALGNADSADFLNVVAGGDAAAAADTFAVIADDGRTDIVILSLGFGAVEGIFVYAVFFAECLKFAVAASYAGGAFSVMVGEKELEVDFSGGTKLRGVGMDDHTFADGRNAGCLEGTRAFDIDEAETAGADLVDVF